MLEEKLLFFMQLVRSGCGAGVWAFSEKGKFYYTSSPYEKELRIFFTTGGCMEYALKEGIKLPGPFLMSDAIGMIWLGEFADRKEKGKLLVLIGPVFYADIPVKKIEQTLKKLNMSVQMLMAARRILVEIPVVSMAILKQYGRMLHCAITGQENLALEFEIQYREQPKKKRNPDEPAKIAYDYERQYHTEQRLLQCVREGNRNYQEIFDEINYSSLDLLSSENPQLAALSRILIFNSQCAQAAIESGVPVKTAKKIEMKYTMAAQKQEFMEDMLKLMNLNHEMLKNYIDKVNEYKGDLGVSVTIKECCLFIKEHLTEPLSLSVIAKKAGYTEYYLTRKFKKEMGIKLTDYIKERRVEHAKMWLATSNKTVQEISELLQFTERTYFTKVFKGIVGISPEAYRESVHHLSEEGE